MRTADADLADRLGQRTPGLALDVRASSTCCSSSAGRASCSASSGRARCSSRASCRHTTARHGAVPARRTRRGGVRRWTSAVASGTSSSACCSPATPSSTASTSASACCYPFVAPQRDERRVLRNAIGPVWDGNEVWLHHRRRRPVRRLPVAYAFAFQRLLPGHHAGALRPDPAGRLARVPRPATAALARVWDLGFFVGSLLPALLFGVAVGNILRGVPMVVADAASPARGLDYAGTFLELLNPYALLVGVLGLACSSCRAPPGRGQEQGRPARPLRGKVRSWLH